MTRLKGITACLGALALTALLATPARANLQICVIDAANPTCVSGANLLSTSTGTLTLTFTDADFSTNTSTGTSNQPGTSLAQLHIISIAQATTAGTTSSCLTCGDGT